MSKIKEFMNEKVLTARSSTPFNDIVQTFTHSKIRHLPITNSDGSLRGIISASDVLDAIHEMDKFALNFQGYSLENKLTVREEMSTDAITISSDSDLQEAISIFVKHGIHALPVMEDEKICGIITPFDILKAIDEGKLNINKKNT